MPRRISAFLQGASDPQAIQCLGVDWSANPAAWNSYAQTFSSAHDQARASRYRRPEDALRHLLGRSLLRQLMHQRHPDAPNPSDWPRDAHGKPVSPVPGLHFSISHSGHQVWLAWCPIAAVGIDVEWLHGTLEPTELLDSLHPNEKSVLQSLPTDQLQTAFMRCWCRKEAISKAVGLGLSLPLDAFEVDPLAGRVNWLRTPPADSPAHWTSTDLPLSPDYQLSLAASAANLPLHYQLLI